MDESSVANSVSSAVYDMNHDETDILITSLQQLSPFFAVSKTRYGGRGCFAADFIPQNSVILTCQNPLSSTITKPFKKEVCHYCFNYLDGATLKFKLSKALPGSKEIFSIHFCQQSCQDNFVKNDIDELHLSSLLLVEKYYIQGLKNLSSKELELKQPETSNLYQTIIDEWAKVDDWDASIKKMKQHKRLNQVPIISDSDYMETKYVVGVLFQLYKAQQVQATVPKGKYLGDFTDDEVNQFEINMFNILQSSELNKVEKYPYLLYSYINIYKFIRLISRQELQPFISPNRVRSIIGKNLSNAFGIWSNVTSKTEDKEFFGFGVYPSASFFNHSCGPNIIKTRIDNKLVFTTLRDIQPGEELNIDYGNYLNEDVLVRRSQLKEWFFDCGCSKCEEDLKQIKP